MTLFKYFINHYKRTNMTQDDNFFSVLVCTFVHRSARKLVQPKFQPSANVSASFRFESNQLLGSIWLNWTEVDRTGLHWTSLKRTGPDLTRLQWIGQDQIEPDWTRLEQIGTDWNRLEQIGSDWIRLKQIGTDLIRLDQIGPDWTGSKWTILDWTGNELHLTLFTQVRSPRHADRGH